MPMTSILYKVYNFFVEVIISLLWLLDCLETFQWS